METYCATFIPGIEELVRDKLSHIKDDVVVTTLENGFVVFQPDLPWRRFQNIRYLNNCFLVLQQGDAKGRDVQGTLKYILGRKINVTRTLKEVVRGAKTFKIVVSVGNQTVAPNRTDLQSAEERIVRGLKLQLNVRAPSIEFWILVRESGQWFFTVRISSLKKENKERADGELRSEMANIMTLVSKPGPTDIVYDPFCGWGAVSSERGYAAPYARIIAADSKRQLAQETEKRLSKLKNVTVLIENSLESSLPAESVTKIITDPPWGGVGTTWESRAIL